MAHKDFGYYVNTVLLKSNAQIYDWANRLNLLESLKKKTEKDFLNLYSKYFSDQYIELNRSFSKEYTTYRFFSKAIDLEQQIRFNTEGVALCLLSATKIHENPLLPAYFGLVCYNDFLLNQNEESLKKFWTQTKYLEKIGVPINNYLAFMYHEDEVLFEVKSPWYSGITQGMIASVFARAYDLSKDAVYKKKARQTLEAMFIPLEEGGVFCKTPDGFDWIEEYPSVSQRTMVLNGFIFSIVAVYEYLIVCGEDEMLEKQLAQLVESLFKTLHHYKWGRFVKYSRNSKSFQNINYQGLTVFQFMHLYELSGNKAFFEIASILNKDVNWAAYFRFHNISPPQYFYNNFPKMTISSTFNL